jgi:hypothetical protein
MYPGLSKRNLYVKSVLLGNQVCKKSGDEAANPSHSGGIAGARDSGQKEATRRPFSDVSAAGRTEETGPHGKNKVASLFLLVN